VATVTRDLLSGKVTQDEHLVTMTSGVYAYHLIFSSTATEKVTRVFLEVTGTHAFLMAKVTRVVFEV